MNAEADTLPEGGVPRAAANEPSLAAIVLIFWGAFAVALIALRVLNPGYFDNQDPDSFLRLVNVRDLVAGQGWFDLVQHRMNPPAGSLMQWSRVVDAPLALLVIVGRAVGLGETLALTVWPILLLLALMGSSAAIAASLGGRAAGIVALVLVLCFVDPLLVYFPNNIDHHNAQIAAALATLAFALRIPRGTPYGFLTGAGVALTLAIGLELLLHLAVLSTAIALSFAWTGKHHRPIAMFGVTVAVLPGVLYALTGSPQAAMACDALSVSFAVPALIAGLGLATLATIGAGWGKGIRVTLLLLVGVASVASFAGIAPQCLAGPYGEIPPEVKAAFLDTVLEALPIWDYFRIEPAQAVGSLGPLLVALVYAVVRLRRDARFVLPTALLAVAFALSFYQVRTLPFAGAVAPPILATWIAGLYMPAKERGLTLRGAWPAILAFVVALPFTWFVLGWAGEKAVAVASGGRIVKVAQPEAPQAESLGTAEANCFDPESAALLAKYPPGLVMAPLFYGSTVLMLSDDSVVAGPYHRNGQAILDTINAMRRTPADAKAIFEARKIEYVAICTSSPEAALGAVTDPDGLLATLLKDKIPAWLTPLPGRAGTHLRLWRVLHQVP